MYYNIEKNHVGEFTLSITPDTKSVLQENYSSIILKGAYEYIDNESSKFIYCQSITDDNVNGINKLGVSNLNNKQFLLI